MSADSLADLADAIEVSLERDNLPHARSLRGLGVSMTFVVDGEALHVTAEGERSPRDAPAELYITTSRRCLADLLAGRRVPRAVLRTREVSVIGTAITLRKAYEGWSNLVHGLARCEAARAHVERWLSPR